MHGAEVPLHGRWSSRFALGAGGIHIALGVQRAEQLARPGPASPWVKQLRAVVPLQNGSKSSCVKVWPADIPAQT